LVVSQSSEMAEKEIIKELNESLDLPEIELQNIARVLSILAVSTASAFSGTHELSEKSLKKLIPLLEEENIPFEEALKKAGMEKKYRFDTDKERYKYIPILKKEINDL
jgi:hypothetical protein